MKWSLNQVNAEDISDVHPGRGWGRHTVVETFANNKLSIRIPHLHVFLVVPQVVYTLLRERHEQ
jgi:hypothetical protein